MVSVFTSLTYSAIILHPIRMINRKLRPFGTVLAWWPKWQTARADRSTKVYVYFTMNILVPPRGTTADTSRVVGTFFYGNLHHLGPPNPSCEDLSTLHFVEDGDRCCPQKMVPFSFGTRTHTQHYAAFSLASIYFSILSKTNQTNPPSSRSS